MFKAREGETFIVQPNVRLGASKSLSDAVNHPSHYTNNASGVECIDVAEHMNFNRGNALKYIWWAGSKGSEIEDLQKAAWYINREILRLKKSKGEG